MKAIPGIPLLAIRTLFVQFELLVRLQVQDTYVNSTHK